MSERQDDGQRGGERRRLDRAPGERYRTGPGPGRAPRGGGPARRTRSILAAAVLADAGAVLLAVLAQLNLGVGLVALGAFTGWLTGIALIWWGRDAVGDRRLRLALAAGLGAWAVAFGFLLDWIWSRVQGGVLDPLDYVGQVHGIVAPLALGAAVLLAAWRAR